jgi:hypothetical protein
MKKSGIPAFLSLTLAFFLLVAPAHASTVGEDIAYAARGTGKLVSSAFAIPSSMLEDSRRVMFPFGLVTGAVRGTFKMITGLVSGVADVAQGAAPYAKYAALAL